MFVMRQLSGIHQANFSNDHLELIRAVCVYMTQFTPYIFNPSVHWDLHFIIDLFSDERTSSRLYLLIFPYRKIFILCLYEFSWVILGRKIRMNSDHTELSPISRSNSWIFSPILKDRCVKIPHPERNFLEREEKFWFFFFPWFQTSIRLGFFLIFKLSIISNYKQEFFKFIFRLFMFVYLCLWLSKETLNVIS